jgi:hypothetical protein
MADLSYSATKMSKTVTVVAGVKTLAVPPMPFLSFTIF